MVFRFNYDDNRPRSFKLTIRSDYDINAPLEGDVDSYHYHAYTRLCLAAEFGSEKLVCQFLREGADVNTPSRNKMFPIHAAVKSKSCKIVKLLLDEGASVNRRDHVEKIPLHLAVETGSLEVITLLLERGADVSALDHRAYQPLFLALVCGGEDPEYRALDITKRLIEYGADVLTRDNYKRSLMMLAVECNEPIELLELLLEKGADVNATGNYGEDALDMAVRLSKLDVVEWLLEHGAKAHTKHYDDLYPNGGEQPYLVASQIFRLLMVNGAVFDAHSKENKSNRWLLVRNPRSSCRQSSVHVESSTGQHGGLQYAVPLDCWAKAEHDRYLTRVRPKLVVQLSQTLFDLTRDLPTILPYELIEKIISYLTINDLLMMTNY